AVWLMVAALAVWLMVPARTPAILGTDGEPLAGSIAELASVELGGAEQTIMLRGHSAENPVLLYLSGGPGQSDLPYSRVLFEDLARDFVVVSWDQRGTGKSYASLEPTTALTLVRSATDLLGARHLARAPSRHASKSGPPISSEPQLGSNVAADEPEPLVEPQRVLPLTIRGELDDRAA